jgi:hypothetical protein
MVTVNDLSMSCPPMMMDMSYVGLWHLIILGPRAGTCNEWTIWYDVYHALKIKINFYFLFKGTQAWEFFDLWFWNSFFFVVSYA